MCSNGSATIRRKLGEGWKIYGGVVGNSGVRSACKELFRFNERRKIWLNCEQLCFAFCVHPGEEGDRGWKRKRMGIRVLKRDDNETFRGGREKGECKSGVCLGYGFSLVVGGFLLETRDLGDRDSRDFMVKSLNFNRE